MTGLMDWKILPEYHSVIHNNDWYSFLGVFITYKFFNFAAECPAYK